MLSFFFVLVLGFMPGANACSCNRPDVARALAEAAAVVEGPVVLGTRTELDQPGEFSVRVEAIYKDVTGLATIGEDLLATYVPCNSHSPTGRSGRNIIWFFTGNRRELKTGFCWLSLRADDATRAQVREAVQRSATPPPIDATPPR